jgi:hypothetical protein
MTLVISGPPILLLLECWLCDTEWLVLGNDKAGFDDDDDDRDSSA